MFPDRVEPGKVFVLHWVVQKGLLEIADLLGICKTKVLLQDTPLMPRSSFPIFRETLGMRGYGVPTLTLEGLLPAW